MAEHYDKPKVSITINITEFGPEDGISAIVTLRENGVDDCLIVANNEKGKNYLGDISLGQPVTVKFMWEDDPELDEWTTVFYGKVSDLSPSLNMAGEICAIRATGQAIALKNMRVTEGYGVQYDYIEYNDLFYVDEFTVEENEWNKTGNSPYLQIGEGDYISLPILDDNLGKDDYAYMFADVDTRDTMVLSEFNLNIKCCSVSATEETEVYLTCDVWDGESWVYLPPKKVPYALDVFGADWVEWDVKEALDPTKINDYKVRVTLWGITGPRDGTVYVTAGCFYLYGYGYKGWDNTLREILTEPTYGIIPKYVEKILGRDDLPASGYTLNTDYIWDWDEQFKYLEFPYESAFDCLRDIVNLSSAMRYPDSGLHWIVRPTGELCIAPVGDHNVEGEDGFTIEDVWATYARDTPLEVTKHMILEDFSTEEPEANFVIVVGNFEYPINDGWTEGSADKWKKLYEFTTIVDHADSVVGDLSVRFQIDGDGGIIYLFACVPETQDLGMNLDAISTKNNIATLSFWNKTSNVDWMKVRLYTSDGNYFESEDVPLGSASFEQAELEVGSLAIGWTAVGSPDWSNINYIAFRFLKTLLGVGPAYIYVDGMKINGVVARAAYDSNNIADYDCKTKVIKDCLAKTDTLNVDDDSNMLALVAKMELLRSRVALTSGKIVIELDPRIKAGQLIHIHSGRTANPEVFKIDQDFRIVEVQFSFSIAGATMTLTLVDDLTNAISIGPVDAYSAIIRAVSPDAQDKTLASLKATKELDIGLTILAKDYPS